ncbi:hypothetical protein ACIBL8_21610 [Streptomyces sp. NPDC050523]|uniref:hypothetical protein n=1 Tax=Streptomyces sp. NPDC050523 TaxID=3365622 RepID=UPI0037904E0E
MSISDPDALDEAFEAALGRRAPFTMVSDWVLLSGATSDARTLYWGLSAHINVTRDDTEVWPGLVTLARMLHLKKPEQVARYMLELEVIGAVDVIRSVAGLNRRNRYVVHQTPPAGYTGMQSLGQWYGANRSARDVADRPLEETPRQRKERDAQFDAWLEAVRAGLKDHCERVTEERKRSRRDGLPIPAVVRFVPPRLEDFRTPLGGGTARPGEFDSSEGNESKTAGHPVPPRKGVHTPAEGGLVPPQKGVEQDEVKQDQEQQDREAPSARSARDGRRPPTGSKRRALSGSAASGAAKASQRSSAVSEQDGSRTKMSPALSAQVRAVEQAFPDALRELLPQYRPRVLRDSIVAALEWRTSDQLSERVNRRWVKWGFATKANIAMGGEGIGSPVGVAVRLVGDGDCRAARCEDGVDIDTGRPCPRCDEQRSTRGYKSDGLPTQKASRGMRAAQRWECVEPSCRAPGKGPRPAGGLCSTCRSDAEEAAVALQQLAAELTHEATQRARDAAPAQEELLGNAHAHHVEQGEADEQVEYRRAEEGTETQQLRDQLAREYPELAAYSQSQATGL